MLRLIINADDLGLTPGCNTGIVRGLTEGIVSDTTLMINTEYAQDAVDLLKQRGIRQAGLHLNLTYGSPLLPAAEVPSLVDGNGLFRRGEKPVEAADSKEAGMELRAQAEKFLNTGLKLTHLDSHHHVHTYPGIFPIALAMASKLGVPLRQRGEAVKQEILAAKVKTSDYFSEEFYGAGATPENLRRIILECPGGVLEIMSHPAQGEELIYSISSYNACREKELAILTSPEMRRFLEDNGVKLVSFADL